MKPYETFTYEAGPTLRNIGDSETFFLILVSTKFTFRNYVERISRLAGAKLTRYHLKTADKLVTEVEFSNGVLTTFFNFQA